MPEIRYIEIYRDGVLVRKEPYEISDEQLAMEALEKVARGLVNRPVLTIPELTDLVKYLMSKVG